jgi:hypothetical protein
MLFILFEYSSSQFPHRINSCLENLTPFYILHHQTTPIIALHFPEASKGGNTMHRPQRHSFAIQVRGCEALQDHHQPPQAQAQADQLTVSPKFISFSAMKLFDRFRKILMRLLFSLPSRGSSSTSAGAASRQKNCDRFEPPKTSCSSYYSSHSHYNEAIADCIEFFNKSSQDGVLDGDGRKSDVMV